MITTFESFKLAEPLARAVSDCGYATPTPVQQAALPPQLEGRDLLALAETGSGKTAAFLLPILQSQALAPRNPKPREALTLILAPTRELALQIDGEVAKLGRHLNIRRAVVLGGVGKGAQIQALKRGVHILVATPGRLLDLISERFCDLSDVRTLVLDEADRMFDMGFIRDIRKIVSLLPKERRNALFSATMPAEIRTLASELLKDAVRVDLSPKQVVVDRIDQRVMFVNAPEKQGRLHTILKDDACTRVIVFTRTKRGADRVTSRLAMAGIAAAAIHGNKAQNARQRALRDFSASHVRVLVATDIAARGIDVSGISHVINFDMPIEPETYVHRIGRTARNGSHGIAISLCDPGERGEIAAIERLMKQRIDVVADVGGDASAIPPARPHYGAGKPVRERTQRGAHDAGSNGRHPRAAQEKGRGERHGHNGHRTSGGGHPQRTNGKKGPHAADVDRRNAHPGGKEAGDARDHKPRQNGPSRQASGGEKHVWNGQRPPKFLNHGPAERRERGR